MNVRPPEADDRDDDLVDPRLRAALRHAPDGSAAPPEALRRAVLQAARASLPPRPTLWQRVFGAGPTMPRAWAAAAGIGAVGLALNLAWHLNSEGPPAEFGPVASKSAPAAAPAMQQSRVEPADTLPAPPPPAKPLQQGARRDAVSPPTQPKPPPHEPVVLATAPAPAPAPLAAPPAPPQLAGEVESEARKKAAAKEESAQTDRVAGAAAGYADKALIEERKAPAPVPISPTMSAAPLTAAADSARNESPAAAAKPAAPAPVAESVARARQSPAPAGVAPAAVQAVPLPAGWPAPLARMQAALTQSDDWPKGWVQQGPAEMAVPGRAWWLAMLAGTAGRWQELREPAPAKLEIQPTWHVSGEPGIRFKLTVADGQAWLQADGGLWRAPWSTLPGSALR